MFFFISYLLSTKAYKGPISSHFDGKRFKNPSRVQAKGFKDVSKYARTRTQDKWTYNYETYVRETPLPKPPKESVQYTFVNHSTFLIQHMGTNILTDPIWSKRCSPFQWAGPARQRPPGIKFEDLPKIDIVLISHNHYDHLDKNTIRRLCKKWNPTFIVPLGVGQIVRKYKGNKIIELDWWQSSRIENLVIKALPANHFSSRGTFDRNTSLWAGFSIQSISKKIYYVGDTGYSDIFKTIGEREGPFDLAFIPIGAYLPRWFMSPIHISPEEAVKVHRDIRSKKSVAMHFGTFKLADDNPERSQKELAEAMSANNIDAQEFQVPEEGFFYQGM